MITLQSKDKPITLKVKENNITLSSSNGKISNIPPIANWNLNEISGDAIDSQENYNGTVVGCTQGIGGKINTCYNFDDDNIIGNYILLNSNPFTFCAWVRYTIKPDGDDGHTIFTPNWDYSGNRGYGWQITHSDGAQGKQRLYMGNSSVTSETNVPDGEWHHVAVVHTGSQVIFYLDGVEDGTTTQSLRNDNTIGYFHIGKESSSSGWRDYKGLIDNLIIYRFALNQEQIDLIYNSGTGTELSNISYGGSSIILKTKENNIILKSKDKNIKLQ